jgi:uncharacterized protein YacL
MTIFNTTLRYLFSLAMAIASVLGFASTPALVAARQVSSLDAIFLMHCSALAAAVFALLAAEARVEWPLSITRTVEVRTKPVVSCRLFLRRAQA